MTLDLADTFEKLANDPSWPTSPIVTIGKLKLDLARLALMVVDAKSDVVFLRHEASLVGNILITAQTLTVVLDNFHIDRDYYANVKQRVEKADTEEK